MFKRRIQHGIGTLLVILITCGLTISAFHSHHTLNWNHQPTEQADTDMTFSADASLCLVCGYLSKTDLSDSSPSEYTLFSTGEICQFDEIIPPFIPNVVQKGRSPPFKV